MPTMDGLGVRVLDRVVDERGNGVDFVRDELLIITDDMVAYQDFLARWGGTELHSVNPADLGVLQGLPPCGWCASIRRWDPRGILWPTWARWRRVAAMTCACPARWGWGRLRRRPPMR
ncbi:MAG: hypothetical protein IPI55_16565 [Flavobacteriales bacterium]|nr:hypothetical protein [Flavobacteriales bacterium]